MIDSEHVEESNMGNDESEDWTLVLFSKSENEIASPIPVETIAIVEALDFEVTMV